MESRDRYFDRIYDTCAPRVKQYILVRIRSVADMEDIFQETWKRFYERTALLRPREPLSYLFTIARGELYRRYKTKRLRFDREEALNDAIPDGQPPFEEALLNRMDASAIFALVEKEPLLSYQCFVLYYGFDQPIREIARALGISEDGVKCRLYRTRERIRAAWKGER